MATLLQYKCPSCGGAIEFNSERQKMKCPYCDTEFDLETLKAYDEDTSQMAEDDMTWESAAGGEWTEDEATGMRMYVCQSCGGEVVGDEHMAATKCPYCDNPALIKGRLTGAFRPDVVLPFTITREEAQAALEKFTSSYDPTVDNNAWFENVKSIAEQIGFAPDVKVFKADPTAYPGHVGDVSMFIRVAVTGKLNSPDLYTIMQIIGKDKVNERINAFIEKEL